MPYPIDLSFHSTGDHEQQHLLAAVMGSTAGAMKGAAAKAAVFKVSDAKQREDAIQDRH